MGRQQYPRLVAVCGRSNGWTVSLLLLGYAYHTASGRGPVGIEAIAATLQEEADTLVDVVEPYLLKIGLLTRTSSGRKVSQDAYQHFGLPVQQGLFG